MNPDQIQKVGLHERVATVLRKEIRGLECGRRLASTTDLARRFSVSVNTIRAALLLLAKEGLLDLKHGRGIYVKESVECRHVGIFTNFDFSLPRVSHFYLQAMLRGQAFFLDRGFQVKLYLTRKESEECSSKSVCGDLMEDVVRGRLCGLLSPAALPQPQCLELVKKHGIPIVVGGLKQDAFSVGHDGVDAIRQGLHRLLQEGRRKIALMEWSVQAQKNETNPLWSMYRTVLDEFGVRVHEEWVRFDLHPCFPGAGWEEFREIWTSRREKPDGLLIGDDMLFQDAAAAILEAGIQVPDQLFVVTHANKGSPIFYPFPTTRMEIDPDAFVSAAGEMLLKLMSGKTISEPHVRLPFTWVEAPLGVKDRLSIPLKGSSGNSPLTDGN